MSPRLTPRALFPKSRISVEIVTHSPPMGILGWAPGDWAALTVTGAVPGQAPRDSQKQLQEQGAVTGGCRGA